MNGHSIALLLFSVILLSCSPQPQVDRSHEALSGLPGSAVILTYNEKPITAADIDAQMKVKIEKARDQLIKEYRDAALEHAYQSLLLELAKKDGAQDVPTYLNTLKSKIEISDAEVNQFLKQNEIANLSKEQAKKFLAEQLWITRQNELKASLLSRAKISWKLSPTTHAIPETNLELSKGAEKYKHKLDIFCDFTNPLCLPVRIGVEQILVRHPNDVRVFFHPLPHLTNNISTSTAIAALCAGKFHQFWKSHDTFYDSQAKLTTADQVSRVVDSISLSQDDKAKLQTCIKSAEGKNLLDLDMEMAKSNGITEAPALLLNGSQVTSIDAIEGLISNK